MLLIANAFSPIRLMSFGILASFPAIIIFFVSFSIMQFSLTSYFLFPSVIENSISSNAVAPICSTVLGIFTLSKFVAKNALRLISLLNLHLTLLSLSYNQ